VELAKVQLGKGPDSAVATLTVLRDALDNCLRLLHPFIPFVTEETWQHVRRAFERAKFAPQSGWPEALIIAKWPAADLALVQSHLATAGEFELLRELVRRIRAVRSENDVEPGRIITALIAAGEMTDFLEAQKDILASLARLDLEQLLITYEVEAPEDAVTISLGQVAVYLPLAGMLDLGKERERLTQELGSLNKHIERLNGLLAGEFSTKAPAAVVERERAKLARYEASRREVEERLAALS
jgi:valyl-tRNA synthetase